ncbi:MAG: BlaI/MecI/CopY family transcriptional regulator [Bacteroidota bacterium]
MTDHTIPSDAELQLLQALWEQPGATVQAVHAWVEASGKAVGYTTVLKQLQRMYAKGLVNRERVGKQHCYRAVKDRVQTESLLIERLSQTAFAGSAIQLALRALGQDKPNQDEIDALESWLNAQKNDQ